MLLLSRKEGDGIGRASRYANAAPEAFLWIERRLASILSRKPGIELAFLDACSTGYALLGKMLSTVRRFDDGVVIVELLQLVEEPTAARAAGAKLSNLSVRLSKSQMNEARTMRLPQDFERFVHIDVAESFLVLDRPLTGGVERQACVYGCIAVLLS